MISGEHLKTVCKLGRGPECCSFLVMKPEGFACAKGTRLEGEIQLRRFLESMTAMGDNCEGWPDHD